MSAIARSEYIQKLLTRANDKCQPLFDEFNQMVQNQQSTVDNVNSLIDSFNSNISISEGENNEDSKNIYSNSINELKNSMTYTIQKTLESITNSIRESILGIINDIDGVSGTVQIISPNVISTENSLSISGGEININISPEDTDLIATLVKDTINSPETKAVVTTTVTGVTSSGEELTGTGLAQAPLSTN